ncbi:MAG: helix-turn-helix domain-containing protein [Chloroflexi bacterium]|nr:helix-turn-helix domain-containing protein [Chloroflexota bacterium]
MVEREAALTLRSLGKTQAEAAEAVGVARNTVSDWERGNNVETDNASIPDQRVSVPKAEHEAIHERHEAGETLAQIAADYHITRERAGQIARQVEARQNTPEPVTEDVPLFLVVGNEPEDA